MTRGQMDMSRVHRQGETTELVPASTARRMSN